MKPEKNHARESSPPALPEVKKVEHKQLISYCMFLFGPKGMSMNPFLRHSKERMKRA